MSKPRQKLLNEFEYFNRYYYHTQERVLMEKNKMAQLKAEAEAYEAPTTKNVSELDKVSVEADLKLKTAMKKDGDTFEYHYIVVDDTEYRVPNSVLEQLKAQLKAKPDMKYFKVSKEGEGLKTIYTVIPL